MSVEKQQEPPPPVSDGGWQTRGLQALFDFVVHMDTLLSRGWVFQACLFNLILGSNVTSTTREAGWAGRSPVQAREGERTGKSVHWEQRRACINQVLQKNTSIICCFTAECKQQRLALSTHLYICMNMDCRGSFIAKLSSTPRYALTNP